MKQIISIVAAVMLIASPAVAQQRKVQKGNGDGQSVEKVQRGGAEWREKMKAEKIAFFTSEIGLSSEDAEKFWPTYNEAEKARRKAFKAVGEAYKALETAIGEGNGVDEKLDAYLKAKKASDAVDEEYLPKFRKVLSAEQVAKVYLAEEKFRRQQIHRIHGNRGGNAPKRQAEGGAR